MWLQSEFVGLITLLVAAQSCVRASLEWNAKELLVVRPPVSIPGMQSGIKGLKAANLGHDGGKGTHTSNFPSGMTPHLQYPTFLADDASSCIAFVPCPQLGISETNQHTWTETSTKQDHRS